MNNDNIKDVRKQLKSLGVDEAQIKEILTLNNKLEELKSESVEIANVYSESINNLSSGEEIKKEIKEEEKEKIQKQKGILLKLKETIDQTNKKLDEKEKKTKFDKVKNKIKKAFFGSQKTEEEESTAQIFRDFSVQDNKKIFDAINGTLQKINSSKQLVDFFNNFVVRYILYHSKVFPTFKKSFMQNVNKIVEVLPKVDLKEDQIRFGKTLGQAIRKQLYNDTNNKFQNWVLILGPARRKGSKNVKNIISNTKAALKNMNKNLGKVDRDDIDEETKVKSISDICKEFGKEEEAMLYLKLGLLSDVKAKGASTDVINAVRRIKGKTDINELESVNITSYSSINELNGDIEKKIKDAVDQGKAEENK
jgi:hypothetical protein